MMKVLICEDESAIRSFVVINLRRAGYEAIEAASGEEAVCLCREHTPDIVLLDVMLPGIDGFEVCRVLRKEYPGLGIVMLTARGQEEEKIFGLKNGADDYVTKPFSPAELLARLEALCRRLEIAGTGDLVSGKYTLQLRRRRLLIDGEPVELTQVEYRILEYFFLHPGRPLSRDDILRAVWGEEYSGVDKVVDVNIRRLRCKVESGDEPTHIKTVWGHGYQWDA